MEEPKPSILDERRNVYDNDEFDVFHREHVDLSKIHAGKRSVVCRMSVQFVTLVCLAVQVDTAIVVSFAILLPFVLEWTCCCCVSIIHLYHV